MKKGRKKNNRIGYMPLEGEGLETNGGGIDPTLEPVYQEPELNPADPLATPGAYDMPDDVAVTLNQPTTDTPPPPQLQTVTTGPVLTEQPAAGSTNWKLIIALVVVGFLLTRKAK